MKVLISSLEKHSSDREIEVKALNYEAANGNFWMSCPMGDDWLQRINSISRLRSTPRWVRQIENRLLVVYETENQAKEFEEWLAFAEGERREGFRTMRD